jgi:hypothetical protein
VKRVLVISDLHCGHRAGLTPPDRQYSESDAEDLSKYGDVQSKMWTWYCDTVKSLGKIDTLVINGDSIDGKADKSGGTELITSDRRLQVAMAADAINLVGAAKIYVIKGTAYHTGTEEDWEEVLADKVGAAHVGFHEWIDAEGVIIDFKHKASSSVVPHGRFTGPARAAVWNVLWSEREMQPRANIIVRSHIHYHIYCGTPERLILTTPALQAWTKFGSREIEGTNDIGLVSIDCEKGEYTWRAHLLDMRFAAARALPA